MSQKIGRVAGSPADRFVRSCVSVPIALSLVCGCRTVMVVATRDEVVARPSKEPGDHVAVYRSELPSQPHKAIGTVRARVKLSPYRTRTWPDQRVLEKMKSKARELGADALVNLQVEPEKGGGTYLTPDGVVSLGNSQVWIATAVVWVSENPNARANEMKLPDNPPKRTSTCLSPR
jgi:hypothetical protein